MKLVEVRGQNPLVWSQNKEIHGEFFCPLLRQGVVGANDVPEEDDSCVYALGLGNGRLASAPALDLRQVGPRTRNFRGPAFPTPPIGSKGHGGVIPVINH